VTTKRKIKIAQREPEEQSDRFVAMLCLLENAAREQSNSADVLLNSKRYELYADPLAAHLFCLP